MNLRNVSIQRIRMNLQQGDTAAARERVDALLREIRHPEQYSGAGVRNALIVAATVYLRAGDAERAQSYAIEAYEIARRVARLPDASADVGEAAFVLAGAHEALGHTEAARPLLGQAVKSLTGALGPDHPQTRAAIEARKRVSPDFS
jgi:tetratricopeptide (TPR) repeat protein